MSSFNSVILFVEIYVNSSFIFSIFASAVFQSWFLSDGNLVFFSDIILFQVSIFISSCCVCVCLVWFGCVIFRLLLLCGSFWLKCSSFSLFAVLIIVLRSYCLDSRFIFWCISNISRSDNQLFFIIVLTWLASLWLVRNLAHSSQISIILFL